jgi:FAD synthetase
MKIVMAGGCFNRVHEGHAYFLSEAKKLGDYLIVVITHDTHNKKDKNKIRPQEERKRNIEKMGMADKVVIGDSDDFLKVVREHKPHVVAIGYDQNMPFLEDVKKLGINVVRISKH